MADLAIHDCVCCGSQLGTPHGSPCIEQINQLRQRRKKIERAIARRFRFGWPFGRDAETGYAEVFAINRKLQELCHSILER